MNETQKQNMQMLKNSYVPKPLQNLNLIDDFLFDVATVDLEACRIIIELSLGIKLKSICWKEGQKVIHKHLHEKIKKIKSSEQMEVTYMKMEERDRLIKEEGIAETIRTFVLSNLNEGIKKEDIVQRLRQYFHLSEAEAWGYLK